MTLQDRLCESCNRALGQELDEELVRTGPIGFLRAAHGLRGRPDHAEVNPFLYRASSGEQPTSMRMPAPEGEGTVLSHFRRDDEGRRIASALRQIVVKSSDGRFEHVPFSPAWSADHLRRALRERGLEGAELVEVYLGEGETPDSEDVRRLLSEVFGAFKGAKVWYGLSDDLMVKHVEAKIGITRKYLRAIAKVGFHYFVAMSPSYRGVEREFDPIRRLIRNDEGDLRTFIEPTTEHFMPQLRQGFRPQRPSHFFYVEVNAEHALARVQFFVGPDDLPRPSLIRLGNSPSRLLARWMRSHWVKYYDQKTDGYDGEIEEMDVTPRRIILP
jgi:hypothetical protein